MGKEDEDDLLPDKDAAKGFYAKYEPKEILGRYVCGRILLIQFTYWINYDTLSTRIESSCLTFFSILFLFIDCLVVCVCEWRKINSLSNQSFLSLFLSLSITTFVGLSFYLTLSPSFTQHKTAIFIEHIECLSIVFVLIPHWMLDVTILLCGGRVCVLRALRAIILRV